MTYKSTLILFTLLAGNIAAMEEMEPNTCGAPASSCKCSHHHAKGSDLSSVDQHHHDHHHHAKESGLSSAGQHQHEHAMEIKSLESDLFPKSPSFSNSSEIKSPQLSEKNSSMFEALTMGIGAISQGNVNVVKVSNPSSIIEENGLNFTVKKQEVSDSQLKESIREEKISQTRPEQSLKVETGNDALTDVEGAAPIYPIEKPPMQRWFAKKVNTKVDVDGSTEVDCEFENAGEEDEDEVIDSDDLETSINIRKEKKIEGFFRGINKRSRNQMLRSCVLR